MRNKLIGIALGLLIAGGFVLRQSRLPGLDSLQLLPENSGAIKTVALQYTRQSGLSSSPCYRAFLGQLEPGTEVIVVCGDDADAASFRHLIADRCLTRARIETVTVGKPITGWCKDRFLVTSDRPAALVHPPAADPGLAARSNDSLVAPALAKAYPNRFRCVELPIRFDAGDIVATRSRVIVSDNLWRKYGRPADFKAQLYRQFGRGVLWLRGVPDHHIGMYAAPLDERTVVVGDPELGRSLWTKASETSLGAADFSSATVAAFKRAARQLRSAGFRVIRAPLIPLGPQTYVTYTNGVFETRGGRRIVYMPVYGDAALDAAGRKAFESAGWQVRPIPVRSVYKFRGTIGCMINVLERS